MSSPTSRTLRILRREGYEAAVVEKWVPGACRRADLFGCIDVLAIRAGEPVLAVQATTAANRAARLTKSKNEPRLRTWMAAGQRFEVWAWAKRGPRGKRKRWAVDRTAVTMAELELKRRADDGKDGSAVA